MVTEKLTAAELLQGVALLALPLEPLRIWGRTTPPQCARDFEELKTWTAEELRCASLVRWDHPDPAGFALWLFPYEWLDAVPEGLEVWSIMGNSGAWEWAEANKQKRAGCMAYGFRIKHRVST
jgi:hypothetical protein